MKITYDSRADAVYIYISKKNTGLKSIPIHDSVNLDLLNDNSVYGIEILNVKSILKKLLK